MASSTLDAASSATVSYVEQTTPPQGALASAGAGITGGYTGDSLSLKIIIAFLLGLALYNSIELIVLIFVTFQRYRGVYFWSLLVSSIGVMPYSLGFLIKFFQLLNPNDNECYVAVVLLSVGWWSMVTGQAVVLWSRLHLVSSSRRVLRWTLYMIITNAIVLHTPTTILTFGSNANDFSPKVLQRFVNGYSIMEKIQMVGFFVQELIISAIYIKETIRILRLSESAVFDDVGSISDGGTHRQLKNSTVRKLMWQLMAINAIIIAVDVALLGVEFANLYLIETTLKGVVYSIKLKLEFAVLGRLVQLVRYKNSTGHATSSGERSGNSHGNNATRGTSTGVTLEKTGSDEHGAGGSGSAGGASIERALSGTGNSTGLVLQQLPSFVDPRRVSNDVTHAAEGNPRLSVGSQAWAWDTDGERDREKWRRTSRNPRETWIDEEMDKHNIG